MNETQKICVPIKHYPRIAGFSFPKYGVHIRKETLHITKLSCILLTVGQIFVLLLGGIISLVGLIYSIGCLCLLYQRYSGIKHVKIIRWFNTSVILLIISVISVVVFNMTLNMLNQ